VDDRLDRTHWHRIPSLGGDMRVLLISFLFAVMLIGGESSSIAEEFISIDQLLSKDQQARLGIPSMRPEQRELLRQALITLFRQGYQIGRRDGLSARALVPQTGVTESQIDGDFEGWEGETIVKLTNGQIWQQTEYHYEYHYAFMPEVLIYPSGGGTR
jgi:hypothetical protein